jgi:hypothetical protein
MQAAGLEEESDRFHLEFHKYYLGTMTITMTMTMTMVCLRTMITKIAGANLGHTLIQTMTAISS